MRKPGLTYTSKELGNPVVSEFRGSLFHGEKAEYPTA